jgi:hypothetical protein
MSVAYAIPIRDEARRIQPIEFSNTQAESTLPIRPDHEGATNPLDWIIYP